MDYVKFFGLAREPFQNDLDGRFYFEGSSQRRARQYLLRAVQQRKGLALLLGGPGLGKTTLAHQLLRDLDARKFAAHLLVSSHRECALGWFLPQLARAYGVKQPATRVPELIEQIHERLLAARLEGRHPVLFVDEAQLLGEPRTLEEFRALLNLAHEGQRVFSLVLFGMEELSGVLALDRSLAQRVDVRARLEAFSAEETAAYLAHRLSCAGGSAELVEADAVEALYRYSAGVLRVLNTLADNALFEAALEECRSVGAGHVAAAAQQLDLPLVEPDSAEEALAAGEAAASFQKIRAEGVALRAAQGPQAESAADDEPLFGESTAESLGRPAAAEPDEDWLQPVAPVLDEVLRSFDEEAAVEISPAEPGATVVNLRADLADSDSSADDDPLEWSLLDASSDPAEPEAPEAPRAEELAALPGAEADDDSMANLSFSDAAAPAADFDEPEELELSDADVAQLILDSPEEPRAAAAGKTPGPQAKGPHIDLPEDDDLDSLFDEIQIEV